MRSRTGYFALPDSAIAPPKSIQALISETAVRQPGATAIGLRAHIPSASSADEQHSFPPAQEPRRNYPRSCRNTIDILPSLKP
jgi:hypothetical protein